MARVGRGTPAGTLLRRYWHPVAAAGEITEQRPVKAVKLLGENLVVFRDRSGDYGLLGERCPHRMASLAYGHVEPDGIRCPYHGWKFDGAGTCLEQPAEPQGSSYRDRVRHTAYPVQKLAGLLFAYLGPEPVPLLPRWDVLVENNGRRWVEIQSVINCNWLQIMENSVDPAHLYWLHGKTAHLGQKVDRYDEEHEFVRFEYGIMKRRITPGARPGDRPSIDQHPLVFPTILRHVFRGGNGAAWHNLQIRVPVDDTHTQVYVAYFEPSEDGTTSDELEARCEHVPLKTADGEYRMDYVFAQDSMAWETQGPITDRSLEHLGVEDEGILALRKLLKEQIESVLAGRDPLGVIRDSGKNNTIRFEVVNERIGVGPGRAQRMA